MTTLKARLYLSSDNEGIWLHRGHLDFTVMQGKVQATSDEQMLVYDYKPFNDPINDTEDFTDFVQMLNSNAIVAVNIGIAGGLNKSGIFNYVLPINASNESVEATTKSIARDYTMLRAQNFTKAYDYVRALLHLKGLTLREAKSYRSQGYYGERHMAYIAKWNSLIRQKQGKQLLDSDLLPYNDNVSIFELYSVSPTTSLLLMYNGDNNTWCYLIEPHDDLKNTGYIARSNNIQSNSDMLSFVDYGLTLISKNSEQ